MSGIKDSNVNIYIIDDDEMLLKILKNKFSTNTNYKLYTFKSAEEFIADYIKYPFSKRQVHIVILDFLLNGNYQSPEYNGIEALKAIKKLNKSINVIMLSGVEDVDIATSAMKLGAESFIKKNENSYLRIQNQIKFIVSQKSLNRSQFDKILSRNIFIAALIMLFIFGLFILFSDYL